tara:strand:+ start:416 stop:565 length:150 start_codon:yes stop_codon:yes gene_type:complete
MLEELCTICLGFCGSCSLIAWVTNKTNMFWLFTAGAGISVFIILGIPNV